MARAPMVTRTIQTTAVTLLCLDLEKGEPFNETITLPRTYKSEKEILKVVEKEFNTDTKKGVHVVDTAINETLYGMTEQKFIENAEVLPSRKATDTTNETENN